MMLFDEDANALNWSVSPMLFALSVMMDGDAHIVNQSISRTNYGLRTNYAVCTVCAGGWNARTVNRDGAMSMMFVRVGKQDNIKLYAIPFICPFRTFLVNAGRGAQVASIHRDREPQRGCRKCTCIHLVTVHNSYFSTGNQDAPYDNGNNSF